MYLELPQVCSPSSLTKAIKVLEDSQCVESAPMILSALERCKGLEGHVRDTLRLRLNMAAGQLAEAARDALELARREQVNSSG
jgi:WD repeat-containing protein 19